MKAAPGPVPAGSPVESMRVAYILPSLQKPSGWFSHSTAFIRAIRRFVEPVLFAAAADAEQARQLFPGVDLHILPATQQASLESWQGSRRLLACYRAVRNQPDPGVDLVHSLEAYPTGLVGSWLSRRLNRPHVLTAHGTYGVVWHRNRLDRMAYEQVLRSARLVCPVSQGTARLMQQYFGRALGRACVRTILNGNDFYQKVPESEALERNIPAIPTILTVGDVKPRKGQHISLAAFARLRSRFPQARYWIAGSYQENEYYRGLQAFIQRQELRDVSFLGAVTDDDLHRLYQQSTLFLLTPQQEGLHFEGFGLVYLEAGAYGLPVVGTRSGGVPDAVREGETGFLADPDDVDGLAEALARLLGDPDLALRMGRANRRWAETLTWERNAAEYHRAYQEALARV